MSKQIVFYGAGEYAAKNHERWLSEGLIPVCYVDMHKKKHYTLFKKYEILPLSTAIEQFPDYELRLTLDPRNLKDATLFLHTQGIPKERIKYADTCTYEWRLGCNWVGSKINISGTHIRICCERFEASNMIPYDINTLGDSLSKYHELSDMFKKSFRSGSPGSCEGCVYLVEGFYTAEDDLRKFHFAGGFKGNCCNLECAYCLCGNGGGASDAQHIAGELVCRFEMERRGCFSWHKYNREF